jgi:hypothetical protein
VYCRGVGVGFSWKQEGMINIYQRREGKCGIFLSDAKIIY